MIILLLSEQWQFLNFLDANQRFARTNIPLASAPHVIRYFEGSSVTATCRAGLLELMIPTSGAVQTKIEQGRLDKLMVQTG